MILTGVVRSSGRFLPLAIIVCGVTLSSIAFVSVREMEGERRQAEFDRAVEAVHSALKREVEFNLHVVASLQSFCRVSLPVTRPGFDEFAAETLSHHSSIQTLEWIPRVPGSQRSALEAAAEESGLRGFHIWEKRPDGGIVTAAARSEYFPVYFLMPYAGNETALGYDLGSDATRMEALQRARDTGALAATGRVRLVQGTAGGSGFLVFAPVYHGDTPPDSIEARRERLEGFALGVFRVGDVVEQGVSREGSAGTDIAVYDGAEPRADRKIYYRVSNRRQPTSSPGTESGVELDTQHWTWRRLDVGGREWLIRYGAPPRAAAGRFSWQSWATLLAGLLFTLLLGTYARAVLSRAEDIQRVVGERTAELTQANEQLQREIAERQRMEEALRWNETLLRSATDTSPFGYLVVDNRSDAILYYNHRFCEIWGIVHLEEPMRRGELKNNYIIKDCVRLVADVAAFAEACKPLQSVENREVVEDEIGFVDGRIIRRFSSQLRDSDDRYLGRFHMFEDVTARRLSEERLRDAHDALERRVQERTAMLSEANVDLREQIAERTRAEKALQYRVEIERLVASVSSSLANLPAKEIDDGIARALQAMGAFSGVGRCYVFQNRKGESAMDNTHEWCAEGVQPQKDKLQGVPHDAIPWWMDKLGRFEAIHVPRVADLPSEAAAEKEMLRAQGIQSLIVVPMVHRGSLMGFLGFDSVERECSWLEEDIRLLNMTGQIIAGVLERKRAEEALRESEERYRLLYQRSLAGFYRSTLDGRILECNQAFARIYGYDSPEELTRLRATELYLDPEDRDKFIASLLEHRTLINLESTGRRKDGQAIHILENVSLIAPESGGSQYIEGTLIDVTERKQLEERLRLSQKLEAIGRLAGGVAHDFNNLLTAILGYSGFLEETLGLNSPLLEEVAAIRKAGERAAALTRQLLAFSRKQVLAPEVLDLNAVVTDLEKMLRRVIGEDIEVALVLGRDLGRVKADPGQLEQVIMNLAVNARDAMPNGGKLIIQTRNADLDRNFARTHSPTEPGSYVLISVSDTGIGMDRDTQSHIFEPFFTTKEKGVGTGLGLATVYGIVKQSGGYIWVASEPGRGSTFDIYLPRLWVEASGPRAPATVRARPEPAGGTILLVEDEDDVRRLVGSILDARGYTVISAGGAQAALDLLASQSRAVNLLLTDLVMPGMNGVDLAARVRALRPGIRILYMSGYTEDNLLRRGISESGLPLLDKPFTAEKLVSQVLAVLRETVDQDTSAEIAVPGRTE
ncbi:MAG: CHASE domain-containing protein [Acidobacteriota bacterium]